MLRFKTLTLLCCFTFVSLTSYALDLNSWLEKGEDLVTSQDDNQGNKSGLTELDINNGLKEALRKGTEAVVSQLSGVDGFNDDPNIHIPLPESLKKVTKVLKEIGYSSWSDELELKLNQAAEKATPKARDLFFNAISSMTLEDVQAIYQGPDDAATQYFKSRMSQPLATEFKPVIDESLDEVGAIQLYDQMTSKYDSVPFVPDIKADLSAHVVDKGLEGVFFYLAREESAIRKDPLKQSTELLKKLFGN